MRNKSITALSKESSVMAIRKIILEKQNSLVCFRNLKYCPNLAVTVYELISQLASAKVTCEDLTKVLVNQSKLGGALSLKLQDVNLIYSEYRKYLQNNNYIDRNDYFSLVTKLNKHLYLTVGGKSGQHSRCVEIVKNLAAKFKI